MAFVEIKKVIKNFGQVRVLKSIDLSIEPLEQCVIQGASGSGKSTLLYLLGGLDQVSGGNIYVSGKDITSFSDEKLAAYRNGTVGFVFQFHYLLPSMSCIDNILLPAQIGNHDIMQVRKFCLELSKQLQVDHCLAKYPFEISGGEQQRINLIRALSLKPKLLLCDEPTGNLDSKNSQKVTELLTQFAKDVGATLVIVTHDANVAKHFDRIVLIEDGRIVS